MNTFIINRVASVLDELGLEYDQEVPMGKYRADFKVRGMPFVIECDGQVHKQYRCVQKRDQGKNYFYRMNGITVLHVEKPHAERLRYLRNRIWGKVCIATGQKFSPRG